MTLPPTNFRELLAHLAFNPWVRAACDDPRVRFANEDLRFVRRRDGGLWFQGEAGQDVYLPIDCGMTPAETGVSFRPDGFDAEKFGVVIRYTYLERWD